jgi:hypothetical protein
LKSSRFGKAQEKANAFKSNRQDQNGKVWFNYFRQNVQVTHFGMVHFDQLWQLGRQINDRLLAQEAISQDCFQPWAEVHGLQQSTLTEDG